MSEIELKSQTFSYSVSVDKDIKLLSFLTRECVHAHERVIAIMAFSLGQLVGSVVNFRACAVNEF